MIESQKKNGYRDAIYVKENEQEVGTVCDVCREEDSINPDPDAPKGTRENIGNLILYCDNCNAAVH
jgi:hypothetical protein